jgi:hypothetical protein
VGAASLIQRYIRETVLYREVLVLGLDKDDQVIRRGLGQKMEFIVKDLAALAPPTDEDLLAYFEAHRDRYQVIWRAPIYYGQPHPARVQLPEGWQTVGEPTVRQPPDSELHRRVVEIAGEGIDRSIIHLPGPEGTVTDVFVGVSRLDGSEASQVVRPLQPFAELRGERPWHVSSGEYPLLGFNHILMGIDHLPFVLGLLHGFGFASGLSTVGMPKAEIPLALLAFNIGVELGQLASVFLILLMARAFRVLESAGPRRAELLPGYAVASLGAFWTIERTVMMV